MAVTQVVKPPVPAPVRMTVKPGALLSALGVVAAVAIAVLRVMLQRAAARILVVIPVLAVLNAVKESVKLRVIKIVRENVIQVVAEVVL
jgi:hypothetical protein